MIDIIIGRWIFLRSSFVDAVSESIWKITSPRNLHLVQESLFWIPNVPRISLVVKRFVFTFAKERCVRVRDHFVVTSFTLKGERIFHSEGTNCPGWKSAKRKGNRAISFWECRRGGRGWDDLELGSIFREGAKVTRSSLKRIRDRNLSSSDGRGYVSGWQGDLRPFSLRWRHARLRDLGTQRWNVQRSLPTLDRVP